MSHTATSAFCRSIKLQCELYPSREVAICLDPYCGLGFVLWCLCRSDPQEQKTGNARNKSNPLIFQSCHQSILIPPSELEVNPALWLSAVSQYKVRDTFCSYSVMELCTKGLGLQTDSLKSRGVDLSRVRTCVVVAEERPRIALTQSFSKLFKDLGLHPRAVSTSFGCRVNLAICLQEDAQIKMQTREHNDNTVTQKMPQLYSSSNRLETIMGTSGPDPTTVYVDMRALRHDSSCQETKCLFSVSAERHDALYVVGALEEAMELRGMRYHPIDIETSVIRTHKSITECAVFTWTNLLVVVVELDGSEHEALDLVPLVTNVVLEEHYLIVGVVVVVDIGVIPINSRGEKQRMHLRDGFLADQLDPIYVAYNM
ncbi:DIP2 disco-interacting protein 2 C [Goodea atripinnis]|uniref:DIP2 disco-interacting protein 2 C n=1 Tax=Goodea atripinnis TaxID=208336 RepID=A0ABV0MQW8_9TELE